MMPARSTAAPGPGRKPPRSSPHNPRSMERPMPRYAPELAESVIDQYLHTDKSVELIARDHEMNERDVTRIRHAAGVPPRRARVRSLPPAMAALLETRALLRASPLGGLVTTQTRPPRAATPPRITAAAARGGRPARRHRPHRTAGRAGARRRGGRRARSSASCRVRRAMRSAARARSPFSPEPLHALARLRGGAHPNTDQP